jgi:hypothetical protein
VDVYGFLLTTVSIRGMVNDMAHQIKTTKREKISLWLDRTTLEWLREHQVTTDVPIAAFVRRAVDEAIEKVRTKKK